MSMKPTYEELQLQLAAVTSERDAAVKAELAWEKTMMDVCGEDGPASVATVIKTQGEQMSAVVAENAGLKSAAEFATADDMWIEQANGMLDYRYVDWYVDVLKAAMETPATDAFLAEVRAQAIADYSRKRGFSFQHGSIHAHFGNGDAMVGATKFENGHAGICFAPVREKDGGVGTEYKWTEGKNTEEVNAVFVISSSSAEGLEVIQNKLAEAIELFAAQLRQGVGQ